MSTPRPAIRQRIHIATAPDGVQLAWARAGSGPVLVKAANWLTHLAYDLESPVWRHWIEFLASHFSFVRYDERGCGMSQREVDAFSEHGWLVDLETVVDAAAIDRPMFLLGISQGAAAVVRYAVAHPGRVAGLVIYGGYAHGWTRRDQAYGNEAEYRAVLEMVRAGWGRDNPVFRQAFTQRFLPEATHEQIDWFNELCRRTVSPETAVRLLESRARADIDDQLDQVGVPTLVLHARRDEVVPFSQGRYLASRIRGAQFVELESRNHVLLEHEPAWRRFCDAVLEFTGLGAEAAAAGRIAALSPRERQVLGLLREGLDNEAIGRRLFISEKTVRNHLSSVYRKLGVGSRAQAIVRTAGGAGPG